MLKIAKQQELEKAQSWFARSFGDPSTGIFPAEFPVSFRFGDQESSAIIKDWEAQWSAPSTQGDATRRVLSLSDPETGLECRCEITTFANYPAIEWVAYFRNGGTADTPIIADIQPLDTLFPLAKEQRARVHHAKGSQCEYDDFQPLETALSHNARLSLASIGGRSSDGALPFFNLEMDGCGVIGAIGWTGNWAATFQRSERGVPVRAGMPCTHLQLYPGEEIRTPRILLVFWDGDRIHGHNMLRRLILAHHTPRPNEEPLRVPISNTAWGERKAEDHVARIRWLRENQLDIEYYWIDAGWHGDNPFDPQADTFGTAWVIQVGNWWPNLATYPQGLGIVGEACKQAGMGFLLWFEPERVYQGTQFTQECPQWLLGPIGTNYLYNLGIPEARQALTDKISALISEGGITCYRQDFNFQPAPYWSAADAPNRVGMSEIRHIEGLYAFWDELLARHPGLVIDNCSSGGRRIDLETISRSVPLWRSDVQCWPDFDPIAMQTQTHGLALWVPLSTGCARSAKAYPFRSALGPGLVMDWASPVFEEGVDLDLDLVRQRLDELHAVRALFHGDFYPLVSFSLAQDCWAAWQFDRPDLGAGMVLALRRPQSPFPLLKTKLHGLDPGAQYEWRDLDRGTIERVSGRDLLETGVSVELEGQPDSALFLYKLLG